MAHIIARQYGRYCNDTEYPSLLAARRAVRELLEAQQVDEKRSVEVIFDGGSWVGVGQSEAGGWVVIGAHPMHEAMAVVRCETKSEARQWAQRFAHLMAGDLVRAAFAHFPGRSDKRIGDHWLLRRSALGCTVTEQHLRKPLD